MENITMESMEEEGRSWAESAASESPEVRARLNKYLEDTQLIEKMKKLNDDLEKIISLNENK